MSQSNLTPKKSSGFFWSTLFLRPYGNNLLTSGGKAVLTIMFIVMFIVAAVEGAAWGYSLGLSSPLFGFVIGFVFFLFMFSLDVSLATTDLMEQKHKKDFSEFFLKDEKGYRKNNVFKRILLSVRCFFRFFVKGVGSFIIRFLIAGISLWITSDFITHFIFRAEIEQSLQQKQNALVEDKKKLLENQREQQIIVFDQKYQQITDKRDEESKTGVGDRTKIFQEDLDALSAEKNIFLDNVDDRLKSLTKAHKDGDFSGLKKEGIIVISDSQTERNNIILGIEKTASFQKTHLAVEILIGILAFGLIFIKLSQPDHLKLYYSSRLQELWRVYKEGQFDKYLPETHRSHIIVPKTGEDALPQQFEQIMYLYMQQKLEWDSLEAERLKAEQQKIRQALEETRYQEERVNTKKRQQEQDEDALLAQQRQEKIDLAKQQQAQLRHEQEQLREKQTLILQQDLEKQVFEHTQFMQNAALEHEQQLQHLQAQMEQEKYQQQMRYEQQQIAIQRQKKEEEAIAKVDASYQVHLEKTAKERALHRDHTRKIEYRIQNLKAGLSQLDDFEEGHKKRYSAEIAELSQQESDKLKQFISMQKDYRTQEKQLENKRRSIEKEESELAHLRLLLETARQGEDSHKSHVVQMVIYYGDAIRKKEGLIQGKKYRLRDFESTQAFFKENCDKVNDELNLIRQKKQKMMEPLNKIIAQRSFLEQECIQVLSDAACVESPYQPFDDAELSYLVSQLQHEIEPLKKPLLLEYQSE